MLLSASRRRWRVGWLVAALALLSTARAFPALYTAKNATSPVNGTYQGANIQYLPVYVIAIIDRVLSVSPQVGQFQAVLELLLEWEDETAYDAMVVSTEKYHNLTISTCQKPCITDFKKDLCCDEVFSVHPQFSNAASVPTIVENLYVSEDGHVYQGLQISGTFYQDFKLKDYPFGSLQAAISMRLSQSLYGNADAVTILPVPVGSKYLETNNGNSAGNGWYISDVQLVGNRPTYVRNLQDWDVIDPLGDNSSAIDWRGAELGSDQFTEGKGLLMSFVALVDSMTPELDVRFTLHVGSVDAFISTLPLALLALLNLAVFMTPLFDARARISFSIQLFFTTTATMLTQNFGGNNQLNAIQRLAVVIFAMLVFTVFSTLIWNGIYNYKDAKAGVLNDWYLLTGKWKTSEVFVPAVSHRDLSPMMSPRGEDNNSEFDSEEVEAVYEPKGADGFKGTNGVVFSGSKKIRTINRGLRASHSIPSPHEVVSKTFGERIRDDRDFRASFCRFGDRICLIACFVVYLVCFVVICTESSNSELYGDLDIENIVSETDEFLNRTQMGNLSVNWI